MEVQENNDFQVEAKPFAPLDSALNELGMLATSTNSRKQYLTENYLNMMTINTRYVREVSVRSRKFRLQSFTRCSCRPYRLPEKERHRTRSENNDVEADVNVAQQIVEDCITESILEVAQLKKAKSLESVVTEGGENKDLKNIRFGSHSELEQMSDGVQKLRVVE